MKILFNLSMLKKGGGQNVGLNFLQAVIQAEKNTDEYFYLVAKNSEIHKFLLNNNLTNVIVTSPSPIIRVVLEKLIHSSLFLKLEIDIIYSYFGYSLFSKKIPQVCGIAVSNVFFPEIKFWHGNFFKVTKGKILDKYRIYGIRKADALIFENKAMEERSHDLFGIPRSRTTFIPPSFDPNFNQEELDLPAFKKNSIKLLMLCGWQLNKNIMRVPEIAFYLKQSNKPFEFIITAPADNSKLHLDFLRLVNNFEVGDVISIIGPVRKHHLQSLYAQIHYVLLMSKLESFSNNIIEAWHYKKPLVVSDEEWARSICYNAAHYIDRESPERIAESILYLQNNQKLRNEIIEEGFSRLKYYPNITEKTLQELTFLEKISNDNKSNN